MINANTCEYGNFQTKASQRNYSVRVPTATTHDDNDEGIIIKDISEQPTWKGSDPFKNIGRTTKFSGPLSLKHVVTPSSNEDDDNGDIVVPNQKPSHIASSKRLSLRDGEDYENDVKTIEPYAIEDENDDDILENCVKNVKDTTVFVELETDSDNDTKTRKKDARAAKDDIKQEPKCAKLVNTMAADFIEVQIPDLISEPCQERGDEVGQDEVSGNTTSFVFESPGIELSKECQKENISSSDAAEVLASEVNVNKEDNKEAHEKTLQEKWSEKETDFKEELGDCRDNVQVSYPEDKYIAKGLPSTEDSFITIHLPDSPRESSQSIVRTDEKSNPSEASEDIYDLTEQTHHPDVTEIKKTETTLETTERAEIYVREVQLTSETNKLIQLSGIRDSNSRVEQQNVDRMTTESHYIPQKTKREESFLATNVTSEERFVESEKVQKKGKRNDNMRYETFKNI